MDTWTVAFLGVFIACLFVAFDSWLGLRMAPGDMCVCLKGLGLDGKRTPVLVFNPSKINR
jgi:hypothetical protein